MLPNVVVGAGIVGLATARAIQNADPDRPIVIIDKESGAARHQTGHNSGVIHSGVYYLPGSLKTRLAIRGGRELKRFCAEHDIPFDVPGKLIVATGRDEIARLSALYERGKTNGVPVRHAEPGEVEEREPHLRALAALVVESTGRVDYGKVAAALAEDLISRGAEFRFGTPVSSVTDSDSRTPTVHAGDRTLSAYRVAVCAGLHADRLAVASGVEPEVRILPFRGEFSEIVPDRAELVRGLVYPVPDPALPFLGVHLTRGIDGVVHVGPNAVPAAAREGYSWGTVSGRDVWDALSYSGTWRLARKYAKTGAQEFIRSLSGRALWKGARRMLPELRRGDLRRSGSGVRAQAVGRDGNLVDDFMFVGHGSVLHVLNAPSPAATASLVIGEYIAKRLLDGDA